MEFGKLPREKNILTRPLYEEVFSEDKGAFSEYYYDQAAPQSTIYAAWEAGQVQAMVHLNPYTLNWRGELVTIPYIVAVATRRSYRHQGLMRHLLEMIFRDLEAEHVPFAFLMPIDEAIYRPFGFFRTWGWQWEEDVISDLTGLDIGPFARGKTDGAGSLTMARAEDLSDDTLSRLASFVNETLTGHYELFTHRTAAYYRKLAKEQKASGGQLMIILKDGKPVCSVQTARENYPPMMCRVMDREACEKRLKGPDDLPFSHAFVCEVV